MKLLVRLMVNSIAVFAAANILPGVSVDSMITALIVAIVLGTINTFIKPALLILTLPLSILTLGLFSFVLNGALVFLVSMVVQGFTVANIWWAMLFSLVVSLVSSFLEGLAR